MAEPNAQFYTVIVQYDRGTYISQVRAADDHQAVLAWCDAFPTSGAPEDLAGLADEVRLDTMDDKSEPTPITGLSFVWCCSAIYRNKLALLNIVKTAS